MPSVRLHDHLLEFTFLPVFRNAVRIIARVVLQHDVFQWPMTMGNFLNQSFSCLPFMIVVV